MAMTLKMLNRKEFVPENGVEYALFTVCKFYGTFEFEYMTAEFHFSMIDAEDGNPLPSSVCYNGQDEIPFDVPVRFNCDNTVRVLDEQEIEHFKNHPDPTQRFWHVKSWFLSDRRHRQLNPEDLDEVSLGIMKVADLKEEVRKANGDLKTNVQPRE